MAEQEKEEMEQMKKLMEQMRKKEYEGLSEEEIAEKERKKEHRRKENIQMLDNTLDILTKGYYRKGEKKVNLRLLASAMRTARVFLPDEIKELEGPPAKVTDGTRATSYSCENTDALSLAWKRCQSQEGISDGGNRENVLVLNLASPSRPGGGVRKGANAQEEDLCRKSSLLLSLESNAAKEYYEYNKTLKTRMGSDAVIISPDVEVIKDARGDLLDESFTVAVMTCAAPMVRMGLEGMSQQEYEKMLYGRINGMLKCAASLGYQNLVLGAFGCGVFGNDAAVVSDAFRSAIDDFMFAGVKGSRIFSHIDFAVLCSPGKDYNFREFDRNFNR